LNHLTFAPESTSSTHAVQHILLGDDDDDDRLLFQDALRHVSSDTKLTTAINGEQLMVKLKEQGFELPDIIFLDLNMPFKNGFECLQEIKQNERLSHIPVIIFSTSAQDYAIKTAYLMGATYYIQKPPTFQGLKDVIRNVLATDDGFARPARDKFLLKP
jgi:CheY-like chemotaxis protein